MCFYRLLIEGVVCLPCGCAQLFWVNLCSCKSHKKQVFGKLQIKFLEFIYKIEEDFLRIFEKIKGKIFRQFSRTRLYFNKNFLLPFKYKNIKFPKF